MQISPILVEHARERDADCQLGNSNTGYSIERINSLLVPTHSNTYISIGMVAFLKPTHLVCKYVLCTCKLSAMGNFVEI